MKLSINKNKTAKSPLKSVKMIALSAVLAGMAGQAMAENEVSLYGGYFFGDTNGAADDMASFYTGVKGENVSPSLNFGARYMYWMGSMGFGGEFSQNGYNIEEDSGNPNFKGSGSATFRTFTLNTSMRLENNTQFTPYGGLGVGLRQSDLSGSGLKSKADFSPSFAISGYGGASYRVNDYLSLFSEIKLDYGARSDANDNSTNKARLPGSMNPSINFGAAVSF